MSSSEVLSRAPRRLTADVVRVSRRSCPAKSVSCAVRVLRGLCVAPLAVLVTLACTSESGPGLNALRIPLINDPILNPVLAPDIGSILINKIIFSALVRPDENLHPVPDLARSWSTSEDGLEYTFNLN